MKTGDDMGEFVRRYRLVVTDEFDEKKYIVLRENVDGKPELRVKATLPRIDARTSDFANKEELLKKIQEESYQVSFSPRANSRKREDRICLFDEKCNTNNILVLGTAYDAFKEIYEPEGYITQKLNVKLKNIAIEYSENKGLSYTPIIYRDNQKIAALASKDQYTSKVDLNDQFVQEVYKRFKQEILNNPNFKNELLFLLGNEMYGKEKYIGERLVGAIYDHLSSDPTTYETAENIIIDSFKSYRTVRDLWLGMEEYKRLGSLPEFISEKPQENVSYDDLIPPEPKMPEPHDDVTNNQYSLFANDGYLDLPKDPDQDGGASKTLGPMPR